MAISKLAKTTIPAAKDNYSQGRSGYKICKITPHHMAGVLTAEQCGAIFQRSSRDASSNYGIGNDGTIICYVDENDRAWTSSSKSNDCQAITIEVSNSSTGGNWPISDAAWNSLIELSVDICTRHNFRLVYDGTKNGSLTCHRMFAATACPGTYLESKLPELARIVNARLDVNSKPETKPEQPSDSYLVKVKVDVLNIREKAGTDSKVVGQIKDHGTYTIIAESDGKGASKWGKLKSGAGWISLDYVDKITSGNVPKETKSTIKKGDKVKMNTNKGYNGERLASWVKGSIFDVLEVSGDRVVIGKGKSITAAVKNTDVTKI